MLAKTVKMTTEVAQEYTKWPSKQQASKFL